MSVEHGYTDPVATCAEVRAQEHEQVRERKKSGGRVGSKCLFLPVWILSPVLLGFSSEQALYCVGGATQP